MTKEQEEAILILKRIKMGIKADTQTPNVNVRDVSRKKVKAIETVLSMLEEKDKQIDLMAKYISAIDVSEDLCKEGACLEDDDHCKVCIKQYFENKAKEK